VTKKNLEEKTSEWLEKISPFNTHEMEFNLYDSALLVIDMQKFFLNPTSPTFTCGGLAIVNNIKKLIKSFRQANRPIIYTKHVHHPQQLDAGIMGWWWEGMCIEGSPESEIHNKLMPLPEEKIVEKHRYSAFYNTDLETILRCLNIKQLVITGVMSNLCCESTARDGYFRDFEIFFVADGTGSISEQMHLATLLNMGFGFARVVSTAQLI
jgi:ureidoacrylate peracid hydrolase